MKHNRLTVLVLGVGGNVSQGILKALAISSLPCRVIAACIDPLSFGLYTADRAYISPRADDPDFIDWLIEVCCTEEVSIILSGAELVLAAMAPYIEYIEKQTGAICLASNPTSLAIANDKLLTCEWLKNNGFNYPRYAPAEDPVALQSLIEEHGYPVLAKPRLGKASNGVRVVNNAAELALVPREPKYVVQEYLGDSSNEYTVGCFIDRASEVRGTIAMRRELVAGTTYRAELGDFSEVRAEAARIAAALKPKGPCNIQLRISKGRPVCFEVNIRFSGSTPMRAHFGFNDVEAAIRHYVLGEEVNLPLVTRGLAIRYWNEMYLDPEAVEILSKTKRLNHPRDCRGVVENYGVY
jgi:carbamoyl-phosphate synthase large subunit